MGSIRVYTKLPYAADTPKPHPNGRDPGEITIVLDPGHGGSQDLGARSFHGWFEKDANLFLAEDIKLSLEEYGYNVVMTRRNDRAIPLYDRPRKSYEVNADAYVSVHHNAPPPDGDRMTTRYQCVYAWNDIGVRLARPIAERMRIARNGVIADRGVLHANFAVTRNPEIPSCLIEADFITHPEGETAAWSESERRRLAAAIAAGIDDWARGRQVAGTTIKPTPPAQRTPDAG